MSEVTVTHSDGRTEVWSVHDLGEDHFAKTNHRYGIACDTGTGRVAKVEGMGEKFRQRALLMAAAPEMLEALELLQGMDFRLDGKLSDHDREIRRRAVAAINKAKGLR